MGRVDLELRKLIDVNTPIIYIQNYDFWRVDEVIKKAVGQEVVENGMIEEWSPALGRTDFITKRAMVDDSRYQSLTDTLSELYLMQIEQQIHLPDRYLVIKDACQELQDNKVISYLHLIGQRRLYDEYFNTTIFIIDSEIVIPKEIEKYVSIFDIPFPNEKEINKLIDKHAEMNEYKRISPKDREALMPTLRGLFEFEIDRMLDFALSNNGSLEEKDRDTLLRQKKAIVKRSGSLELVETNERLEDIGGLENLKNYLKKKSVVVSNLGEAEANGVETPKGILIVGMPGCGKSLCAKATATQFKQPLLKLDMGSMMKSLLGESEASLRKALKIAEAAAPCVLWIDEIEKGFSGVDEKNQHNDSLMRMYGYFLSWMQEKKSPVYVVATANNVENLPPELKRKGRFDEIFCVKLPNDNEMKQIIEIHLNKGIRAKCPKADELNDIDIKKCKEFYGFCGADIEAVIKEAIEQCYLDWKDGIADEKDVKTEDGKIKLTWDRIKKVKEKTHSITDTSGPQIKNMNNILKEFTDASAG